MSTRCYILNLPIEILDLVYKYIPDMRDKLNFAKAHDVLGKAFAFHVGDMFKTINIGDRPIQEWSDILSLCGSSVTKINTWDMSTTVDVVKLASMYCPNLEEFSFPVRSSFWKHIKPLLLPLQNLVKIELINNFENVNVVETMLQMPKLTKIKLLSFNPQDLEEVGKLANLTDLTIINEDILKIFSPKKGIEEQLWPNIDYIHICNIDFHTSLPYLPTLKHLIINNTRMSLTDVFGQSAFSYGKSLEELHFVPEYRIINADEIGIISNLKALKRLDAPSGGDICMEVISQNLENLEVLILTSDCNSDISNRGVMMVINGCKKLRYLDITPCHKVDRSMVMEAVSALSLRPKMDKPFLLNVSFYFGRVDKSQLGGVLDIKKKNPPFWHNSVVD